MFESIENNLVLYKFTAYDSFFCRLEQYKTKAQKAKTGIISLEKYDERGSQTTASA